jgi:hypothetical protein
MDIFDALTKYGDPRPRRCPQCGGDDVKFATHAGSFSTSAQCCDPACKHFEQSNDPEALLLDWLVAGHLLTVRTDSHALTAPAYFWRRAVDHPMLKPFRS